MSSKVYGKSLYENCGAYTGRLGGYHVSNGIPTNNGPKPTSITNAYVYSRADEHWLPTNDPSKTNDPKGNGKYIDQKVAAAVAALRKSTAAGKPTPFSSIALKPFPVMAIAAPSRTAYRSIRDSADSEDSAYSEFDPISFAGKDESRPISSEVSNFEDSPLIQGRSTTLLNSAPSITKSIEQRVENIMRDSSVNKKKSIYEDTESIDLGNGGRKRNIGCPNNYSTVNEDYAFPRTLPPRPKRCGNYLALPPPPKRRGNYLALPPPPKRHGNYLALPPPPKYIIKMQAADTLPDPYEFGPETIEMAKKIIKLSKEQHLTVPVSRSEAVQVALRIWRLGRRVYRPVPGSAAIHDPLSPTQPMEREMDKAIEVLKRAEVSEFTGTTTSWKLAYQMMGKILEDNYKRY